MKYISIMELRDLRAFVAVAEELHFGRAARRLHMAQPPLSQRVKALEDELGTRLFERTSRAVSLTGPGRVFLERARATLDLADQAAREVRQAGRGESGRLRAGFMGPAMDGPLPLALRAFRERVPDVSLELAEKPTPAQIEDILSGRLDAGFVRAFGETPSGLATRCFTREPYVAAIPSGHPLAGRERIPLAALAGEVFILFPRAGNPGLFDAMARACADCGFTPRISQEASTKKTGMSLAAAGFGVALVPASARNFTRKGTVLVDVDGPLPLVEIHLATRTGRPDPALSRFIETVMEFKSEEG